MIKNVIELLSLSDYYGVSERVDIAKGKYELPSSWKDVFKKIKRYNKTDREVVTWAIIWNKVKHLWQKKLK